MTAPCPLCVTPPDWLARRATAHGRLTRRSPVEAPADHEVCLEHVELVRGYRKVRAWNEEIFAGRKQTREELREEVRAKERTTW